MRVAIYAFDGVSMFHLAAPQVVFGEIARLGLAPGWETLLWSTRPGAVRTGEGYSIEPVHGPEVLDDADIVVIPSWPSELPEIDTMLRELILRAHGRGALVAGLCLGAFAVADSGLLRNRSAVTH